MEHEPGVNGFDWEKEGKLPTLSTREKLELQKRELSKIELTGDTIKDTESLLFACGFAEKVPELRASKSEASFLRSMISVNNRFMDDNQEPKEHRECEDLEREVMILQDELAEKILQAAGEPISTDTQEWASKAAQTGKEKIQLNHEIGEQLAQNSATTEKGYTFEEVIARLEKVQSEVLDEVKRTELRINTLHDTSIKQLDNFDKVDPKIISQQRQGFDHSRTLFLITIKNVKEDIDSFMAHVHQYPEHPEFRPDEVVNSEDTNTLVLRLRSLTSPLYGLNEQLDILEKSFKQAESFFKNEQ
ncbi:MAG: hypothetical protein Q7S37_05245 [bacterium]|nr:hypothetical protein [bacterium]